MEDSPTTNSVTDRGSYIEMLISGPQSAETIHPVNLQLHAAASDFMAKNKPILVLAVLANIPSKFNLGGFRESLKTAEFIKFNRVAISGDLPHTMMTIIDSVINSFDHSFEIQYFSEKDKALAWLKAYNP